MRRLLIFLLAASLVSCGSDDDSTARDSVDFTGVWPEESAEDRG